MSYFYLLASALIILFQLGCQSFQSRNPPSALPGGNNLPQVRNVETPSPKLLPDDNAPGSNPDEPELAEGMPVKPRPLPDIPKIGIILGPGEVVFMVRLEFFKNCKKIKFQFKVLQEWRWVRWLRVFTLGETQSMMLNGKCLKLRKMIYSKKI